MQQASKVLIAILVSAPGAILIPFAGWCYGWRAIGLIIGFQLILAYFCAVWISRRATNIWLWCLSCAAFPFLIAAWIIAHYSADAAGWAEMSLGVAVLLVIPIALRLQLKAR